MDHHVRHVAVDKQLTRLQADDLIGRHRIRKPNRTSHP